MHPKRKAPLICENCNCTELSQTSFEKNSNLCFICTYETLTTRKRRLLNKSTQEELLSSANLQLECYKAITSNYWTSMNEIVSTKKKRIKQKIERDFCSLLNRMPEIETLQFEVNKKISSLLSENSLKDEIRLFQEDLSSVEKKLAEIKEQKTLPSFESNLKSLNWEEYSLMKDNRLELNYSTLKKVFHTLPDFIEEVLSESKRKLYFKLKPNVFPLTKSKDDELTMLNIDKLKETENLINNAFSISQDIRVSEMIYTDDLYMVSKPWFDECQRISSFKQILDGGIPNLDTLTEDDKDKNLGQINLDIMFRSESSLQHNKDFYFIPTDSWHFLNENFGGIEYKLEPATFNGVKCAYSSITLNKIKFCLFDKEILYPPVGKPYSGLKIYELWLDESHTLLHLTYWLRSHFNLPLDSILTYYGIKEEDLDAINKSLHGKQDGQQVYIEGYCVEDACFSEWDSEIVLCASESSIVENIEPLIPLRMIRMKKCQNKRCGKRFEMMCTDFKMRKVQGKKFYFCSQGCLEAFKNPHNR